MAKNLYKHPKLHEDDSKYVVYERRHHYACFQMKIITVTELRILQYICEQFSEETGRWFVTPMEAIRDYLDLPMPRVRKAVQKLIELKILLHGEYEDGRGAVMACPDWGINGMGLDLVPQKRKSRKKALHEQ